MPPAPLNGALNVMVLPASDTKVTTPGPGLVVSVAGTVATQVQLVPLGPIVFVPRVPAVFVVRFTVRKLPPERLIEKTCVPAAALLMTPWAPTYTSPPETLTVSQSVSPALPLPPNLNHPQQTPPPLIFTAP